MKVFKNCILVFHSYFLDILLSHEQALTVPSRSNSANFRHCNFFCFSQQQEKIWRTEEFYSFWRNSRKWINCWRNYPAIQKRRINLSNYRNEKDSFELKFSLTLQGYSRKAYNYVRETNSGIWHKNTKLILFKNTKLIYCLKILS